LLTSSYWQKKIETARRDAKTCGWFDLSATPVCISQASPFDYSPSELEISRPCVARTSGN
jgi:hypothetical protein